MNVDTEAIEHVRIAMEAGKYLAYIRAIEAAWMAGFLTDLHREAMLKANPYRDRRGEI